MNVKPNHARGHTRRGRDEGYITVMFSLLLVPLMLFAALGIDVGGWYSRGSQLQKAADAAALAGVVWMPDLTTATSVANTTLVANGVNPGGNISVKVQQGSVLNTLQVTVTDAKVKPYLGGFVLPSISISRTATAQYVLPVPMGSPLNYFGGDATQYQGTPATSSSTYTRPAGSTKPDSYQCSMAATGQGSTPPASAPSKNQTPPGYFDATGTYRSGNPPDTGDDPAGHAASWTWSSPQWNWNVQKNTGTKQKPKWTTTSTPYPLCTWTTTTAAVPGPIPADQSPGFWAAVEGPGTNSVNGDAYSPRCYSSGGSVGNGTRDPYCTALTNPQYRSTGYWYTVTIPKTNAPSSIAVQVFDASYNPSKGQTTGTGDNALGDPTVFTTTYTVYKQNVPVDFSNRTQVPNCQWNLTNQAAYQDVWQTLCTLNPQPGDVYQINVRSSDPNNKGDGSNNYALRAVGNSGSQPQLAAYGDMAIYNNIQGSSGSYAVANFYVVNVPAMFAGKTLDIDLWDAGDTNGNAWLTVMAPSSTSTSGTAVPASQCTYSADHPSPAPTGVGATVSSRAPTSTDQSFTGGSGTCSVKTSNGSAIYNGEWIRLRVKIPASYTCNDTVNPVTTPGSCWWQMRYTFGSQAHDNTTWSARIEGNPVHLIQ